MAITGTSQTFLPAKFHNFILNGLFFIHKNKRVQFFMKHGVEWLIGYGVKARPNAADRGGGMYACCSAEPAVRETGGRTVAAASEIVIQSAAGHETDSHKH